MVDLWPRGNPKYPKAQTFWTMYISLDFPILRISANATQNKEIETQKYDLCLITREYELQKKG